MLLAAACAGVLAQELAPTNCGELTNGYGPYDYRTDRDKLGIVEGAHFTPEVEMLIRGKGGYLEGDIDYTLRAFPNHHRALVAMMRLGERMKVNKLPRANYEVECYFIRATRFRRDDGIVRMLYAGYLGKRQRVAEAAHQLEIAKNTAGDNPFTHYNIGMVYMDLNDTEHAMEQARIAMELGFPRTELADRLKKAGKWVEPAADKASAPGAGTAAAPSAPASAASSN
jgi:hypothetical protein